MGDSGGLSLVGVCSALRRHQRYYVAPSGSDSTPCDQVSLQAARRTIDSGIACLMVGIRWRWLGRVSELLVAGPGTQESVRTVQANTTAIPNGTSAHPTMLKAELRSSGVASSYRHLPWWGRGISTVPGAEHLRFEGVIWMAWINIRERCTSRVRAWSYPCRSHQGRGQCVASQTESDYITLSHLTSTMWTDGS